MNRSMQKAVLDIGLWCFAGVVAFFIRLDLPLPDYAKQMLGYGLLGLVIKAVLVVQFGIHRQTWHKVGVRDLYRLVVVVFSWMTFLYVLNFLLFRYTRVPRSVPLIEGFMAILFLSGMRLLARVFHEREQTRVAQPNVVSVLIVGAGEAGTMLAREMLRHPEGGLLPVGFLDDEPLKAKQKIVGLPVLGKIKDLESVAYHHAVQEVLIAMPSVEGQLIRDIVHAARGAKLRYRIIPGVFEILNGTVSVSQIREVDVEDLLRRSPVKLNMSEISRYLEERTVLVTGAGGSIGSEIVRQVAQFRPRKTILLGRGENSIYLIEQELRRTWPEMPIETIICDVRDVSKLERTFLLYKPQVVFHAAAHKHVPLMEQHPDEAIINNVLGTRNVVNMCLKFDVDRLVNISSDKAVNPSSVMGASKRLAEHVVDLGATKAKANKYFVSVRFGNVLGSRGSVIPLFRTQIKQGGPVTITDAAMTRYFMTIPEAAQLVLQAGGLAQNGAVYVLDMGEPIKIIDLAKDLIRLSGFEVGKDIDIVVTGMRPGEKLFEELLTAEEGTASSQYEKIFIAKKRAAPETLGEKLEELWQAAHAHDPDWIKRLLCDIIPTYKEPSRTTSNEA